VSVSVDQYLWRFGGIWAGFHFATEGRETGREGLESTFALYQPLSINACLSFGGQAPFGAS
jgi:hypothetical protein